MNKKFVKEIGEVLARTPRMGIAKVELEIWHNTKDPELTEELLVVTYRGGAIAVRNCSMNSELANLNEIATLAYGGYYSEVEDYREMVASGEWIKEPEDE